MGKRSNYEPKPRDKYYTPLDAVKPLKQFLEYGIVYFEPCAGDGAIVAALDVVSPYSLCVLATDVEPEKEWILQLDANNLTDDDLKNCGYIITNPPYTWNVLRPLMDKFISLRPTILLLPADFMHNLRMKPYMEKCVWVKSVGRVKWQEESKGVGMENSCWYMFDKDKPIDEPTSVYRRD